MRRRRWALAAGIAALLALVLPAPARAAAPTWSPAPALSAPTALAWTNPAAPSDFTSIFATDGPGLEGSGWGQCSTPISWSVDLGTLDPTAGERAIADLTWAFETWTTVSGLRFAFGGTTDFGYDDAAFTLTADSTPPARHIDIAFLDAATSTRLAGQTVGLGTPAQVLPDQREIVAGTAIFRTDHTADAGRDEVRSLYLHEIGHVLGLGHANAGANIMYPMVGSQDELGAGDVNGIRSILKPCSSA